MNHAKRALSRRTLFDGVPARHLYGYTFCSICGDRVEGSEGVVDYIVLGRGREQHAAHAHCVRHLWDSLAEDRELNQPFTPTL